MKKLFSLSVFFLVSAPLLFANVSAYNKDTCPIGQNDGVSRASKKRKLNAFGNLTFFKDFTSVNNDKNPSNILRADYSKGLGTATFTATRSASAPATYVDSRGVVQLVTSRDIPRFAGGYYDETGFHSAKGLMIEGAVANLIPKSVTIDDATWTETNSVAANADVGSTSPDGTTTAPSLTASAGNGNILLTSAVTARTYSVWLKRKTGTGTINITANGGTTWTAVTLTSSWGRFQTTVVSASQKCGIQIVTSGDAVYVWGNQFETIPYMTSYVPTTNGTLTRGAEVLKYPISGNRTAASESIFIKFMPMGGSFANDGTNRFLTGTEGSNRYIVKLTTGTVLRTDVNATDSGSVIKAGTVNNLINTSYVHASVIQHSSPYIALYSNGVGDGTYTGGDFINNTWNAGTNFYIGSSSASLGQIDGLIQSVEFYSDAKSSTYVKNITNILKS